MTHTISTQHLTFGDVTVSRVVEQIESVGMTPRQFFPTTDDATWIDNESWLAPHFLVQDGDSTMEHSCRMAMQTWVLRSGGKTILIDTGVGNHKERPYVAIWSHLDTRFLDALAAAGVQPEDVDIVVNTHLHPDHVGWNTRLEGRAWVPTFPNAQYLMPAEDIAFWNPANRHDTVLGVGAQNVWEDSVAPVIAAGLVTEWTGTHRIDDNLVLEAAPGHTPGSSILRLTSGTDEVLFIGDILHSPAQIPSHHTNSCFCEDEEGARATRTRIFTEAAERDLLMFPAHFGGHGGFRVTQTDSGFTVRDWAPIEAL
jgi:glyoxylase-like metal-dependent hydrolase (beta-lactamase superfamily II)